MVQEIVRFMNVDTAFMNVRPLRYCATFDSYPVSLPYVARFHAKKVLKFQDALLTSYHRNEVNSVSSSHCWLYFNPFWNSITIQQGKKKYCE